MIVPHVRCGAPARRGGCGNPDAQFKAVFICVYLRLFAFIYVYIHT